MFYKLLDLIPYGLLIRGMVIDKQATSDIIS